MIRKVRHPTSVQSLFGKPSPIGRHTYMPSTPCGTPPLTQFSHCSDVFTHSIFTTGYAVALFTPTIVHDLGYSAANAQLLSVPPFACAGVSAAIICFYSDRANLRGPFMVLCSTISMIGYIIAYTTSQPGPGYAATVLAASGAYPNVALSLTWSGSNAGGNMKRGIVLGLVIGLGNLGGCVSPRIEVVGRWVRSRLECHTIGSVLHSSTISLHVFIRATEPY